MNATAAPSIPYPVAVVAQPCRNLFCDTCQTWTPHALTKNKTHYVCGCGAAIVYHINNAPPMMAIAL